MKPSPIVPSAAAIQQQLQPLADRCVQCGLCLPHCPTYRATRHEAASPRGRLALMAAIANASLPASAAAASLQGCLGCRSCEVICPSGVAYDSAHSLAMALLPQPLSRPARLLRWLLTGQQYSARQLRRQLRHYCGSALQRQLRRWLPRHSHLAALEARLPDGAAIAPRPARQSATQPIDRVLLFAGCSSELLQPRTVAAALRLLQQLGYHVELLDDRYCCGALHRHSGDLTTAATRRAATLAPLAIDPQRPLLLLSSACASELRADHPQPQQIEEIGHFLQRVWPTDRPLQPLAWRVLLHTPCSQRNGLRQGHTTEQLLRRIPALQITTLDPQRYPCCGGGGLSQLTASPTANQLQAAIWKAAQGYHAIVTSNVGCVTQLRGRDAPPLYHPVELLAAALDCDH